MIVIPVIFGLIMFFEWGYLKRNNRSPRTIRIVMSIAIYLMVCMEAIYMFRNSYTVATFMETIFNPIERAIFAEM
ncbi:hypothetical protein HQN89_36650 [Paenibacillus frigoriresistens]|uniref:hypothetical protein n=1 Tax=Paenibacillus alginolyticus TaxID=59839 RepID=UPI001565D21A|nr:hypothetical protein [Paenibacillus frigoriresistens]NRF96284.1 hypothetical protein [Paenibacillus frigoriresistens]